MNTSSTSNPRISLLDLPTEVLLRVLTLLMQDVYQIQLYPDLQQTYSSQVLRTCRHLYQVASTVLYEQNDFSLPVWSINAFRQSMGDRNFGRIKRLTIHATPWCRSKDPSPLTNLGAAASAGIFKGLKVLDCAISHPISSLPPCRYISTIYEILLDIVDREDLPNLDRLSKLKKLSTETTLRYRLSLSTEPLEEGEKVLRLMKGVHVPKVEKNAKEN